MSRRLHYLLPLLILLAAAPAMALDASEVALVVNHNMPDGMKLAQLYAKTRGIPDNRIIELDLPTSEQMSFEDYERNVVPPIRQFLRLNDPQRHIRCLVTFYGVPFRITAHVDSPEELAELRDLHAQLDEQGGKLKSMTEEAEKMALSYDSSFTPLGNGPSVPADEPMQINGLQIDSFAHRIDHAGKSMVMAIQKLTDPQQHDAKANELMALVKRLNGPVQISTTAPAEAAGPTKPDTAGSDAPIAAMPLEDRRFDPASRALARQEIAKSSGIFGYVKMLLGQIAYLAPQDSEAATDNELSLLWWTFYPRQRWQLNTLYYRFSGAGKSPSLMIARLDAPTPEVVRQIIVSSFAAEQRGLNGRVVIDARGLQLQPPGEKADPKANSYAAYDESLRTLAALIHLKTSLQLTFDDLPDVLPPHSVQDVALYCGWYSVGKYVPACSFVPGAVGFHIASFEMVSLRDPGNSGWVRGLLNDGIAATLGPVSEPYLQSFPRPDEFFPLLLTGKLTLAETYWKTEPMASWRQCLVGDPLYNPFKNDPALKISDLPATLQTVFQPRASATSGPATDARATDARATDARAN